MRVFILLSFLYTGICFSQDDSDRLSTCRTMLIIASIDEYATTKDQQIYYETSSVVSELSEEEIQDIRDIGGEFTFKKLFGLGADVSNSQIKKVANASLDGKAKAGLNKLAETMYSRSPNIEALKQVNVCIKLILESEKDSELVTLTSEHKGEKNYSLNLSYNPRLPVEATVVSSYCENCKVNMIGSGDLVALQSNEVLPKGFKLRVENSILIEKLDVNKPTFITIHTIIGSEGESKTVSLEIPVTRSKSETVNSTVNMQLGKIISTSFNELGTERNISIRGNSNGGFECYSSKGTIGSAVYEQEISIPSEAKTFEFVLSDIRSKSNLSGGDATLLNLYAFTFPVHPDDLWKKRYQSIWYKPFVTTPSAPFEYEREFKSIEASRPASGKVYFYIQFYDSWKAAVVNIQCNKIELVYNVTN